MKPEVGKRLRLLASAVSVLVLIGVIAIAWIYSRVRASLPVLDGTVPVAGLSAAVKIERDALGVPTIRGETRADVARALGFLHAQDRFFQMDLWRRVAAGELAEVFGEKVLARDRAIRRHGFRRTAQAVLAQLPPNERAVLEAYTAGVNAGLAALREKPFEYLFVRATPQPWKPEDTLLVCDAMLIDLQDENATYERTLMALRDNFGPEAVAFFAPLFTSADAALDGSTAPAAAIPSPRVLDLRLGKTSAARAQEKTAPGAIGLASVTTDETAETFSFPSHDPEARAGSNCFALAGRHTASGAALLANDMHLDYSVPNTWYRASIEYPGHKTTGVTLPGTPLIVAGSNGHVAWGFTNAYADTGDLIALDVNPVAGTLYRAPGYKDLLEIEKRHETILVHGAAPVEVDYEWTIWGPIIGRDDRGRLLAYRWTGHDAAARNLGLINMEDARDVSAAIDVAHHAGVPALNIVVADSAGDVAWTIAGWLPKRVGYDGRLPVTFQFGDRNWEGYLPPEDVPVVTTRVHGQTAETAALDGRIWSANQRMIGGAALAKIGDGGYARPNRAAQIRDALAKVEQAKPADLLAIQLDDRALFLTPWHKLLLDTLTPAATEERKVRGALRGYAEKWEGRASVDAVSYPIVRLFRAAVYARVFPALFHSIGGGEDAFRWQTLHLEDAIWSLLRERPAHLLNPEFASWDALLLVAVDDTIVALDRTGVRLPYATWGQRNAAQIRHPFHYSMPALLRSWIDMPADPQPGDVDMPRVQTPTHGASERFVVSPGREAEGIFEMPCGQSGHPLSPYYRAGHEAWLRGEPTPFLPGKTEHTLTLQPR